MATVAELDKELKELKAIVHELHSTQSTTDDVSELLGEEGFWDIANMSPEALRRLADRKEADARFGPTELRALASKKGGTASHRPTLREILLWNLSDKDLKALAASKDVKGTTSAELISKLLKL